MSFLSQLHFAVLKRRPVGQPIVGIDDQQLSDDEHQKCEQCAGDARAELEVRQVCLPAEQTVLLTLVESGLFFGRRVAVRVGGTCIVVVVVVEVRVEQIELVEQKAAAGERHGTTEVDRLTPTTGWLQIARVHECHTRSMTSSPIVGHAGARAGWWLVVVLCEKLLVIAHGQVEAIAHQVGVGALELDLAVAHVEDALHFGQQVYLMSDKDADLGLEELIETAAKQIQMLHKYSIYLYVCLSAFSNEHICIYIHKEVQGDWWY